MRLSSFAATVEGETAFTVLAAARALKAAGKDVVELEIGDSPFPTTHSGRKAGIAAIEGGHTGYGPSIGLPEFREAASEFVSREFGIPAGPDNIVVGPGAKIFELLFCELFCDPGDGVLVFTPHFPTYPANVARRGARLVLAPLSDAHDFRPDLGAVAHFLETDPAPRAVFLNSPHNPTGGVADAADLSDLAELLDGTDVALFSDEPYCHMIWRGAHASPAALPGMLDRTVAAYTFSKSYSMSGWRLGFAVASAEAAARMGVLINTSLSCVPPFVQLAGMAALEADTAERADTMEAFAKKVDLLAGGLHEIPGVRVVPPAGTFYVFPNVKQICNEFGLTSAGLAAYLLEGADDEFGVACLGGECFGAAGGGFLRFSCAEPDDRIAQAIEFTANAFADAGRLRRFVAERPELRAAIPYV